MIKAAEIVYIAFNQLLTLLCSIVCQQIPIPNIFQHLYDVLYCSGCSLRNYIYLSGFINYIARTTSASHSLFRSHLGPYLTVVANL